MNDLKAEMMKDLLKKSIERLERQAKEAHKAAGNPDSEDYVYSPYDHGRCWGLKSSICEMRIFLSYLTVEAE